MKLDDLIQHEMATQHIPGLSLAIVHQGEVILTKGYGFANLELNVPATPATIYQLASLTKQFTATAIMLLVNEAQLDLEATIGHYLADTSAAWQGVTIRHLLTHTGGLMRDGTPAYWTTPADMQQDYSYPQMFQMIAQHPLDFAPGTQSSYSNSGYFLLGLVVEQIAQQPLNTFFTQRIFQPLGMTATRINDLRAIIPHRATGYTWTEEGWQHPDFISLTHHFANGGLVSNVTDLAKWDAALYTERILPQSHLHTMWTPATLQDGTTSDYGFGWAISMHEGQRLVSHGGGLPGFSTYIARFIDAGITVILLTNRDGITSGAIAKSVAGFYLPGHATAP